MDDGLSNDELEYLRAVFAHARTDHETYAPGVWVRAPDLWRSGRLSHWVKQDWVRPGAVYPAEAPSEDWYALTELGADMLTSGGLLHRLAAAGG